jgi:diguanylate cyclase (GGDEF)-like protein
VEGLKRSLLLIASAALLTYFLRPFKFVPLDLAFLLYSLAIFNLSRDLRTASIGLFVALPHTLFGSESLVPLIVALGASMRAEKTAFRKRLSDFLKYYCVYALAVVFFVRTTNPVWKSLLLSFLPFLLMFLSQRDKYKWFFVEDAIFVPSLACLHIIGQYGRSWWILIVFALNFVVYRWLLDYKMKTRELSKFESNYKDFRKKLAKLVEMVDSTSQSSSIYESLNKLAEVISSLIGFKYVLISVLNRDLGVIQRVAQHGIGEEEFKRLKQNPPPIEYVLRFTQERFKVSNSYFIPEGALDLPAEYVATLLNGPMEDEPDAWRPNDMLIVPIRSPMNEMVGYISVDAPQSGKRPRVEDIQIMELVADQAYKLLERSQLYHDVVARVSYDPHTLLLTHSAFLGVLEAEIDRGNRFAVVILDVDDLSSINARFGHEAGDQLLEKISDILRNRTRKTDVAARFGGEEFALLLRNVTKSKAIEITDRLLEGVRRIEFNVRVSLSAGIAMFPEHGRTTQELIKVAIQALQIAKMSGKDRLMIL